MRRDDTIASVTAVSKRRKPSTTVFYTLADTTWRVAVPVLLFSSLGIFIDKMLHLVPLFTLLGLVLGLVGAGLLVWQQLKEAADSESPK